MKNQLQNTNLSTEERVDITMQAIAKYRSVLENDLNNESALLGLVELYSTTPRMDSLLYFVERLIAVCPNENYLGYAANIYSNLYQATRDQNMLTNMFAIYQRMVNENPYSAQNYYQLAMLYSQLGNKNKATSIMEECMQKNGRHFEANYYNAIFTAQMGNGVNAIEMMEKTMKKFPTHAKECQSVIDQIQGVQKK